MKISNRFIILVTLILSTSYIFGIDYYDKKETKVKELYEKLTLPDVTYTHINVELSGIRTGEKLDERELASKQIQSIDELSHSYSCSKLCTQVHTSNADTELTREESTLGILVTENDIETPYNVSIKTRKDIGYNTYYKIATQGLENVNQIDNLRNHAYRLFEKWRIKPKESLYFTGRAASQLTTIQRKAYVQTLFERLKAAQRGYYLDDYSKDTEAYYGYTKEIKDYIIDNNGQKTNLQISFSYNEYERTTQIIIAFPFYNEPF